jgi:hypothetical protein
MPRLTIEEKQWILREYMKWENAAEVRRIWRQQFNTQPPNRKTIYRISKAFNGTDFLESPDPDADDSDILESVANFAVTQLDTHPTSDESPICIMEDDNSTSSGSEFAPPRTRKRIAKKTANNFTLEDSQPLTRRQAAKANSGKEKQPFLANFNPETSERERRKLNQKLQHHMVSGSSTTTTSAPKRYSNSVNNSKGIHINTGKNMCDCFNLECVGCFFPCKKCGSSKCGYECRVNRKTIYESIEYHGFSGIKRNPLYDK